MSGAERIKTEKDLHQKWFAFPVPPSKRVISESRKANSSFQPPNICKKRAQYWYRRLLSAEMQHVVYKEWLPEILGLEAAAANDLYPLTSGYSQYDASVDATVLNEFGAAAFRFGHSLVNDSFLR